MTQHTATHCPLCAMRQAAAPEFVTALIPSVSLFKASAPTATRYLIGA